MITGLAAAILLGIGKINYDQLSQDNAIILFLAAAALAGLFATRKFLFHLTEQQNSETPEEVSDR